MGTKGTFDILFDNIVDILEASAAAQPAGEEFTVYADRYRSLRDASPGAYVVAYLGPINPRNQGGQAYFEMDVDYYIDMIVTAKGTTASTQYLRAAEAAGIRLRYLIQQVFTALYPAGNRTLSLNSDYVSKKPLARVDIFPPDQQEAESPVAAARLTLTVGLSWEPIPLTGTPLDSISVTADKWSAIYEP